MFITETFEKEYIERYVNENLNIFKNKKLLIHTVGEQGINLYELLAERNIAVYAFAESSVKLIGKKIYGLPVIKIEEIPQDSFIIVSSPDTIYLNISGEPLMSEKFWEVLDYIDKSSNDPYLFTITNALLLNEKAAERIVNSTFKMVTISMDAATPKTYKRLRRGGDFNIWLENVKNFLRLRNESGRKNFEINILYTAQRECLPEIPDAIKIAGEIGIDKIEIHPLYNLSEKQTWVVPVDEEFTYFYPQ